MFIQNRHNQKISVRVIENKKQKGLVFIEHGLTGSKDQPTIKEIEKAFFEIECTAVSFDATNSIGESDGDVEKVTFTNHYSDLEDVIAWGKSQKWYREPFALSGHSLGGMATTIFSQKNPNKVNLLLPISPATSGKHLELAKKSTSDNSFYDEWRAKGYYDKTSKFNGKKVKVPFALQLDLYKYSVFDEIENLKCPTYIISGDADTTTPISFVREFYDAINCEKKLEIVENLPHTFYDKENLENFAKALRKVLKKDTK